ncbi:Outer membrane protein TolC [Chitinophaga rupis]|uniref:Outer membrane protein TolC n=1 Tax=Chitinophaga rupis TaxID=573321 RepID=A0A1H7QHM8_9BACT|nr:TolC family protein [Chitinophaga rupis]SEL47299.1 Outer membrane protein TolC [Chitinophaga rupis]
MNAKSKYRSLWMLVLPLLLAFSIPGRAQDGKVLTLKDAIDLSIKNSKQLRLNQTKITSALNAVKDAKARQLPDANISGSYLRVNKPNIDLKSSGDSSGGGSSFADVNQVAYGMATISVPLFSGFKIQAAKESARYLAEAAKLDADLDREDVIQNTVAAYSNLYKATVAVNLVRENLKQQEQRTTDFSNMEKNGIMARNDLLKAQLQQSNIEVALTQAESDLKIARINMNIMLGLPENTNMDLDTTFLAQAGGEEKAVTDWEQVAQQKRKDAASLQAHEKAAYAGIKSAKGDYYPSLALTGGYVAAYIPNVITVTNAVNVGVGLKYNLASLWKTGSKVDDAKNELNAVKINEEMLNDQIHIQVNQAYENYIVSMKKIGMYEKAIEQADENYRITKNKHTNALATTTDLLEADVAELQAKLNYTSARADAVVAYNKLLQSAGLLGENK